MDTQATISASEIGIPKLNNSFAVNNTNNKNKKKNYHGCFVPFDDAENLSATFGLDPLTEEIIRQEENRRLYQAIAQLTPTQRRRIYMLMDDMKYCDIASKEGKCVSAIHESIDKALKKLRRLLSE